MSGILLSGFIVFLGFLMIAGKLSLKTNLKLLGQAMWVDLVVTVVAFAMHFGTFSGVMAAAVAGLLCSMATGLLIKLIGYIKNGTYYPGYFNLANNLTK